MLLERLLDNLALSVDAFATCSVAGGWRLRLPALDHPTLHYVLRGEGGVRDAKGRTVALPPGSLALVPPHLVHSLQCGSPPFGQAEPGSESVASTELPEHRAGLPEEDDDALLVICGRIEVRYGEGPGLFDQMRNVLVLDFSTDPVMPSIFERMLDEVRGARPGSRAMTSALMRECLIRVFRELCEHDECSISWLSGLEDPVLGPAVEAMLEHPERPHSVASLAAMVYLSRSAFARKFRESFGQPPLAYLRGVRLRTAARLLKETPPLPIAAVASRSGFSSRSQFSRAFRDYFGRPPTEFRA